ncbi:hypothetical protein PMZ80_007903 [Knufia obscura]|uniref:Uncharacterized protein n=2 Tax=Knufia TaxID=430999 RepID=A0AAN8EAQ2_9EURO|nr:hypothetical protein PMZ80_007903 [Knufia obscura]KAK5949450.1 hypothetical protein OHC33_009442 [Knufia fluminis]
MPDLPPNVKVAIAQAVCSLFEATDDTRHKRSLVLLAAISREWKSAVLAALRVLFRPGPWNWAVRLHRRIRAATGDQLRWPLPAPSQPPRRTNARPGQRR